MNPPLSMMDRIVDLAHGRAVTGTTDAVVRTEVLSQPYGYHIDVVRVHGRVLVVAADAEWDSRAAIERDPIHVAQIP
jgi:zinc/manganese transport system ATP-binding protein